MKKTISILALLAIVATGAFAADFSLAVGGGGLFDWSIANSKEDFPVVGGYDISYDISQRNLSIGGFVFFDATYAELDVSFAYGMITAEGEYNGYMYQLTSADMGDGSMLQLGFSLLGKYPISLGRHYLFPLLGADYNMVLSYTSSYGKFDKAMDLSQFGLLGGVGFDLHFTNALFLRAEAMFHFRFLDKLTSEAYDSLESLGYDSDKPYGMGPRVKLGLGYRFGGGSGSTSSSSSRYMVVNTDTLNVRKGPSADTALVGTLSRNTRVEVLSRSGTWWKIKSGKIEGYVNSSYLK